MIYRALKLIFDKFFAICCILLLSPIYLLTALLIFISSPGPVFYRARRVGKDGAEFICYKFRSMCVASGAVRLTTLADDERIFPFGRFIRKTKIDELPQMWNILKGQMSVVGPRPEDVENAGLYYTGAFREILSVKPGLTSPASLYDYTHGERYSTEEQYAREFMPIKLRLELYYVQHRSISIDFKTIVKTACFILLKLLGKHRFPEPPELKQKEMTELVYSNE